MREGFDVGMEMSGQPAALRDMLANMTHGGKIAMLGLPADEIAIDWSTVVLNMLTIKGIYGREMFETWYSMSVMLERGLDLTPVITHRFGYGDFEQAFDVARQGQCGKVIMDWTTRIPGGEALMFGRMRDDLTATIGEIRDAGLYKSERVITSPQSAADLRCLTATRC